MMVSWTLSSTYVPFSGNSPRRTDHAVTASHGSQESPKSCHPATASKQKPKPPISQEPNRPDTIRTTMSSKESSKSKDKDKSKVHKLSLKGSSRLVAEFVRFVSLPPCHCSTNFRRAPLSSSNTLSIPFCMPRLRTAVPYMPTNPSSLSFQRGVYPAEDFAAFVPPTDIPPVKLRLTTLPV